ncbi:cyclin-dependent kinase 10, partial [Caerostris extrusa]
LLFGSEYYTTAIDIWSAVDRTLGTPNEKTWPGCSELPLIQSFTLCDQPYNRLTLKFSDECTTCIALIYKIFTYNPCKAEECLSHPYFTEAPKACDLNTLVDLLRKPNEI